MAILFFLYRYRHYFCFDETVVQKYSHRYDGGQSNKGFHGDNIQLEKRESNSLEEHVERSDSKDPVYWTTPEKRANAGIKFDVDSADSNSHYQKLVHPFEVNSDKSEV